MPRLKISEVFLRCAEELFLEDDNNHSCACDTLRNFYGWDRWSTPGEDGHTAKMLFQLFFKPTSADEDSPWFGACTYAIMPIHVQGSVRGFYSSNKKTVLKNKMHRINALLFMAEFLKDQSD